MQSVMDITERPDQEFFIFLALFAVMFLMPFYLEELLALPVQTVGILMTAVPLSIAVVAPISGRLSDRFGSQN